MEKYYYLLDCCGWTNTDFINILILTFMYTWLCAGQKLFLFFITIELYCLCRIIWKTTINFFLIYKFSLEYSNILLLSSLIFYCCIFFSLKILQKSSVSKTMYNRKPPTNSTEICTKQTPIFEVFIHVYKHSGLSL